MNKDKCYFCGKKEPLENHHIVPRRLGGSDEEDNLLTLCSNCHSKIEKIYNDKFYSKIGVDVDGDRDQLGKYECSICNTKFIDTMSSHPKCPRCNKQPEVVFVSRVSDEFSRLDVPELWRAKEINQKFVVWFSYKGRDDAFIYPKGSEPVVFDSKVEAYEKVGYLVSKDLVDDAGVHYFESVEDIDDVQNPDKFFKNILGHEVRETPQVKVYKKLVNYQEAHGSPVDLNEFADSLDIPDEEVFDLVSDLGSKGEIWMPEKNKVEVV